MNYVVNRNEHENKIT